MSAATEDFTEPEHACHLLELFYDRNNQRGQIYDPVENAVLVQLPRQEPGRGTAFINHPESRLSDAFTQYLAYLYSEHLLLTEPPTDFLQVESQETRAGTGSVCFDYFELAMRIPVATACLLNTDNTIGFNFIDGQLYGTVYIDVIETNNPHR